MASFEASPIAFLRIHFSSSVALGIFIAAMKVLKDSVSLFISSTNLNLRDSLLPTTSSISCQLSLYFSLPIVRLATIETSAEPREAQRAATLPPPGAGESEASSSRNARISILSNFIDIPPLFFYKFCQIFIVSYKRNGDVTVASLAVELSDC